MTEPTPQNAAPSEQLLKDAFVVLEQAVQAQADAAQWPTASQVRVAMKRLTYDGFDPEELGYKRFRDFLHAAEAAGHVALRWDRPGDVVVAMAGAESPSKEATRVRIRRDLWQAALDWKQGVDHYLDLNIDRALALPREPVRLEPERLRQLRLRVADQDPQVVKVARISIGQQLDWMKTHVESVPEGPLRSLLVQALASDKPAKVFAAVLRDQPAAQDRWFARLSANVLAHLQQWKQSEPRLADLQIEAPNSPVQAEAGKVLADKSGDSLAALIEDFQRGPRAHNMRLADRLFVRDRMVLNSEERLRAILHQAIDQMPEAELRALRIPAGYLLGD